jgi:hypothetical protein
VTALRNPFTPSSIASHPGDFFGRTEELNELERALEQGSLAKAQSDSSSLRSSSLNRLRSSVTSRKGAILTR